MLNLYYRLRDDVKSIFGGYGYVDWLELVRGGFDIHCFIS